MLTSIDVKFIFDSARLLASLGDKGFFSSANILQIAMLSIKLSSCCLFCVFSQTFADFFLVNQVKKVPPFCIAQTTEPRLEVLV